LENIHGIIQGCRLGDEFCRRKLYEEYKGFAMKITFRYIYRYEHAVDVVNDGFVKAFLNFEQFQPNEEEQTEKILMGWLKRIMINTSIDHLRAKKMTPEIGGIPEHVWEITSHHQADQLILYKDLISALKNIQPLYRSIFNLYVIDGYNHIEIADLLGISVGTSKSGLSRARQLLQTRILQMEDQSYVNTR
jgi:RNA polymerase sigma-70 factor (ECF subfamily)